MPLLRRDRRAQAGFEAGPGCGAHGRWRGLAGLRGEAWLRCPWAVAGPGRTTSRHTSTRQHTRSHWCGGRRRVRRARAGFEIDHSERSSRVAISRAAGPAGARNTSGATSNTINEAGRRPRCSQAPRPGPPAPGTPARDKRADRDPAARKVAARRAGGQSG